jgi:hypothetical protein
MHCIRASSLLWLVNPDRYVGTSASLEIGYAVAAGTPVYSTDLPNDATLQQYVAIVPNVDGAISRVKALARDATRRSLLVDPVAALSRCQEAMETLSNVMKGDQERRPRTVGATLSSTKRLLVHTFCSK